MKTAFQSIFQRYWNPYITLSIAGILSTIYFGLTGSLWAVTGEFTRLGGHILQILGVDISDWTYFDMIHMKGTTWTRPDGWIVWGMFIGSLITVLLSNQFKIRLPKQKRRYVQGLIGGIIAGFGARLALGCNLAAFFTGLPQFSIHSWIFIMATGVGTYLGAKVTKMRWWKGKPALTRGSHVQSMVKKRVVQPYVGAIFALLYAALVIYFFVVGKSILGFAALFGAFFGILIERGQICFTSAFRDLWLVGRSVMAKAIIAGMAVSSILTVIVLAVYGMEPVTKIAAPSTFIGGVLFGLGIVMASSCETGMMYRLMEGQVLYITVFVGNIIGATLLAYSWDHWGLYNSIVKSGEEFNLYESIGPIGAIIATLLMLGLLYVLTIIWERRYKHKLSLRRGGKHYVG